MDTNRSTGQEKTNPSFAERLAGIRLAVERSIARTQRNLRQRLHDKDPAVRRETIGMLSVAGFMGLVLIGWLVLLFLTPSGKTLEKTQLDQATIAYTSDGEELTRYQLENRVWVPLDSISPHIVEALLATEDHRFYRHNGIDVSRIFGAAWHTLTGNPQGGSTITMQFARNAFPSIRSDFTPLRKIEEWLISLRMEEHFEKDEILEMYLNTVPFIYNAFGIEAASQVYFQKSARDLNELESAVLIGMLKGTVYYNPVRNPERSHERRNVVLSQMVKHGYLEQARFDSLRTQETPLNFKKPSRSDNMAPHFAEYTRQWLDEWAEKNGYNLYTDGLKVFTTIDSRLQQAAEAAAKEVGADLQTVGAVEWSRSSSPYFSSQARDYQSYSKRVNGFEYLRTAKPELFDQAIRQHTAYQNAVEGGMPPDSALALMRSDSTVVSEVRATVQWLDVGFVALDPRDGQVRAWVGGRDFERNQYDHVAQAKRQPGSTFKPFVYITALERGYRPNDRLPDSVVTYRDPDTRRTWRPTNSGSASGRLITLKDALAYSKNTVTAQLVAELGPHRVASTARRMGIQSELDEVPSIGLGTSPVTLLEMTAAYTPLASQGRYHEPIVVTRIEDRDGRVLATFGPGSRSVLADYTAYTVLDMMRGVVDYGTGQRIRSQYGARGDLAGKTGTSQNGADGWFMLMHPNLVMGAWVGFNTPSIHFRSNYWGQGSHTALHIVGKFYQQVRKATDVLEEVQFEEPYGYTPPAPPDTLSYADSLYAFGDSSYRSAYDSLYAEADSMLAATDDMLRGKWGIESDDAIEYDTTGFDSEQRRRKERTIWADTIQTTPMTPADSLNMLQKQRGLNEDVLEGNPTRTPRRQPPTRSPRRTPPDSTQGDSQQRR